MSQSSRNSSPNRVKVKISTLEKMIKPFTGEKRDKLYPFIDNCDIAMKLADDDQKIILFDIIKCNILDNARLLIRNRDFEDWSSLKQYLLDAYTDRRSHGQWQLEMNSCRQKANENVLDYATKIENFLVKLMNSLDEDLTAEEKKANVKLLRTQAQNAFITGLQRDLSLIVKSQKPTSLEDAIALALAEETEIKSRYETQRFGQKFCGICNKSGHTKADCYKNASHSKEEKVRAINAEAKFCNYCKNKGHTIPECRKLAFKNSNQEKSLNGNNSSATAAPKKIKGLTAEESGQ